MVMTEEMMESVEKDHLIFLATATKDGVPNVVPIGFARPIDNKTILIVDNYMNKTRENLENNPKASLVPRDATSCPYQFKGTVEIHNSGKLFDEAVDWAKSVMSKLPAKAAIIFKVEEIYSVKPGPDAGSKVD
ncbi:MAG: pyridoxamine 5'-phosphate oxidase family protein [Methanobacterium sp.]|uniref:pyridoxamine 5'-phosphate oxidase family protein n=1 Tax=Methanobacterium sp. TaxID=2164 RepID=UPI003D65771D|nr:pyridoxamine 5'-phosphate oxidase family protein [Methanobacterium sp.]